MSQIDVPGDHFSQEQFVISSTGEFDVAERAELWDRVDYSISTRPTGVVIDLAAVTSWVPVG
jgi:anti-anti-sigma regulatory factor